MALNSLATRHKVLRPIFIKVNDFIKQTYNQNLGIEIGSIESIGKRHFIAQNFDIHRGPLLTAGLA